MSLPSEIKASQERLPNDRPGEVTGGDHQPFRLHPICETVVPVSSTSSCRKIRHAFHEESYKIQINWKLACGVYGSAKLFQTPLVRDLSVDCVCLG